MPPRRSGQRRSPRLGGTIVRVETDTDGNAAYEAHMTKPDGTPVTVFVDTSYSVVGVETR